MAQPLHDRAGIPFDFVRQGELESLDPGSYVLADLVTKQLIIPDKLKLIGVSGDSDSRVIPFLLERTPDLMDLETDTLEVHYKNADGLSGRQIIRTVLLRGSYVIFDFVIPNSLASKDGEVKIWIYAHSDTKAWKLAAGVFEIVRGEFAEPIDPSDPKYDILDQMLDEMQDLKKDMDDAVQTVNTANQALSALSAANQQGSVLNQELGDKIATQGALVGALAQQTEQSLRDIQIAGDANVARIAQSTNEYRNTIVTLGVRDLEFIQQGRWIYPRHGGKIVGKIGPLDLAEVSDQLELVIEAQNGDHFSETNSLYCHVYCDGVELDDEQITSHGELKWYRGQDDPTVTDCLAKGRTYSTAQEGAYKCALIAENAGECGSNMITIHKNVDVEG